MAAPTMRRLGDLVPIHAPGLNPITERDLRKLADEELLRTVTAPLDGQMLKARPGSGRLLDGNTRLREMQRRMATPGGLFTPDTPVPVEEDF